MLNSVDNHESSTAGSMAAAGMHDSFPCLLLHVLSAAALQSPLYQSHEPPEAAHNEEWQCRLTHLPCHDRRLLVEAPWG